jgi:hypothetical protein
MVFWCTYPDSILNRDNLVYSSAYPGGTLAFPTDIPRVYSAGYSRCHLGMAGENVVSFFTKKVTACCGRRAGLLRVVFVR